MIGKIFIQTEIYIMEFRISSTFHRLDLYLLSSLTYKKIDLHTSIYDNHLKSQIITSHQKQVCQKLIANRILDSITVLHQKKIQQIHIVTKILQPKTRRKIQNKMKNPKSKTINKNQIRKIFTLQKTLVHHMEKVILKEIIKIFFRRIHIMGKICKNNKKAKVKEIYTQNINKNSHLNQISKVRINSTQQTNYANPLPKIPILQKIKIILLDPNLLKINFCIDFIGNRPLSMQGNNKFEIFRKTQQQQSNNDFNKLFILMIFKVQQLHQIKFIDQNNQRQGNLTPASNLQVVPVAQGFQTIDLTAIANQVGSPNLPKGVFFSRI